MVENDCLKVKTLLFWLLVIAGIIVLLTSFRELYQHISHSTFNRPVWIKDNSIKYQLLVSPTSLCREAVIAESCDYHDQYRVAKLLCDHVSNHETDSGFSGVSLNLEV